VQVINIPTKLAKTDELYQRLADKAVPLITSGAANGGEGRITVNLTDASLYKIQEYGS